jgi:hypothetical protein
MTNRLAALMAVLLVLCFVVAGCGDDDESASEAPTATETVTDTDVDTVTDEDVVTDTETVTEQTDTEVTPDNGGATPPADVEAAVDRCKQSVTATPGLSADTKADLEELCDKAASGNVEDAKAASRAVCQKIVADLYPAGVPGKDKALAACERGQ